MKFRRTVTINEYVLGYVENMEIHEVKRVEKTGRLGREIPKQLSKETGKRIMILNTIKHQKAYECSLEDFLSIATEVEDENEPRIADAMDEETL